MIGDALFSRLENPERGFRWRGGNISRLEQLADAVFAFALTLLVVSLAVPQTFADLSVAIRRFPAFAVCFFLLVMCWYYHYKFFRRYGLEDFPVMILNTLLLFTVLFYVYPLKFVFTMLIDPLVGIPNTVPGADGAPVARIQQDQVRWLMLFYSAGLAGIFTLFLLMYRHAWKLRELLQLDARERVMTRFAMRSHGIMIGFGVVSMALAATGNAYCVGISGWIYFLVGFVQWWNGAAEGRALRALAAHQPTGASAPAPGP